MSDAAAAHPRAALQAAGLAPKHSWGQNFLCSERILSRLVAAVERSGPEGSPIVELGAGTGALTAPLAATAAPLIAIERDRELAVLLRQRFAAAPRLWVVEANAACLDVAHALAEVDLSGPARVAGNLPYQLASRILVHLAGQASAVAGGVFMVQKEVGERLSAAPGSRAFSLLSVLVQRAFTVSPLFDVPASAFFPRPKVTSQVVSFSRRPGPCLASDPALVATARLAFSARRRTLARVLADRLGVGRDATAEVISSIGLAPAARAETLQLEDFARLGAALSAAGWLARPDAEA